MKHQMVEEFIRKRFINNCNWLDGNCYYFAIILKARFPQAIILYDVINGHFVVSIDNKLYDWSGKIENNSEYIVWEQADKYDPLVKERIIRDCIL